MSSMKESVWKKWVGNVRVPIIVNVNWDGDGREEEGAGGGGGSEAEGEFPAEEVGEVVGVVGVVVAG